MDFFSKLLPRFRTKTKDKETEPPKQQETDNARWGLSQQSFHRESAVDLDAGLDSNHHAGADPVVEKDDNSSQPGKIVRSLNYWNPETCVRLLSMPSVQNYSKLRKLISQSNREWMKEFLEMKGLEVLFETMDRLSSGQSQRGKMENALLVLQCVSCLKAVENSRNALYFISRRRSYANRLSEVMSSQNSLVKKHLFELMATLCIFAEEGHNLTLDILESHRVSQRKRYRFLVLVEEMKRAEVLPYVASLLALINCVILGACGFRLRTRIRNEFLVLGLSELMCSLVHLPDEEISLQCSVFGKSQEADEEHARSLGLRTATSHYILFQAVLDKVEDTPHASSFLILLQNLNLLDPSDIKSDYVWSALEEITDRAITYPESVSLNSPSGLFNLLKTASRGTQTPPIRRLVQKSASPLDGEGLQRNRQFRPRRREDDEGSITSFGSRDSGVLVSRTESWASNDSPSSPSPSSSLSSRQRSGPVAQQEKTDFNKPEGEVNSDSKSSGPNKITNGAPALPKVGTFTTKVKYEAVSSSKHIPSDLHRSSNPPFSESNNSLPILKCDTPISDTSAQVSTPKKLLPFSLSFWKKSKKYSINEPLQLPQVRIHPPSPDLRQQQRSGMTSIDLKRSRKKSHMSSPQVESAVDIESSVTSAEEATNSNCDVFSEALEKNLESHSEDSRASGETPVPSISPQPPPPPPPPPPPSAGLDASSVQLRVKEVDMLTIPSKKQNRSSWSSPPAKNEFQGIPCYPIYNTLPRPKSKMKTLNWAKIPSFRVHAQSIWGEINQEGDSVQLDFEKAEQLFCQKETTATLRRDQEPRIRQKMPVQMSLIESKRSLSIGIYLKQFKGGLDELVHFISACKHKSIGSERLRTLLTLLPEEHEVKALKSYRGDSSEFGSVEHFILRLDAVSNGHARVEGMLLVEDYPAAIRALNEHIQSFLNACEELLSNEGLKNFLKLVLVTGNFINTDSYAGNAVGFSLSTLPKLLETRANRPRLTLLHYLVDESFKKDPDSLNFTTVLLNSLSPCARLGLDSVKGELKQIGKGLNRLDDAIKKGDRELKKHFGKFVQNAKRHQVGLEKKVTDIEKLSAQLAGWFCEEETKFQLEECLSIFYSFCIRIKMANAENHEFKIAEEKRLSNEKSPTGTRKK